MQAAESRFLRGRGMCTHDPTQGSPQGQSMRCGLPGSHSEALLIPLTHTAIRDNRSNLTKEAATGWRNTTEARVHVL